MSKESKIIRAKRARNFTIINNDIFSQGMSLQAIGLLTYLLSKPDDWNIQKKSLHRNFKNGRDATNTAFNELIESGYIEVKQNREAGRFKSVDYIVYDEKLPQTENPFTVKNTPRTEKPDTVNPDTEKPDTENPPLLNTDNNKDLFNKELFVNSSELTISGNPDETISQTASLDKKEKSCAKKEKSTHAILMDVYWEWYKSRNAGATPNITKADGQGMSLLTKYFESLVQQKSPREQVGEESFKAQCENAFRYVLENWDSLPNFERSQVSLRQINSNITNIINYLRNGRNTQKAGAKQDPIGTAKNAFENIDKAFGGRGR